MVCECYLRSYFVYEFVSSMLLFHYQIYPEELIPIISLFAVNLKLEKKIQVKLIDDLLITNYQQISTGYSFKSNLDLQFRSMCSYCIVK